jgi:hypothetical protein
MPISWSLDAQRRLVFITLTPPYTRDQGLALVTALTAHPEFATSLGFVVELIGDAETAFVSDVLYFLATHRETFRGARVAIVVTMASRSVGKPVLSEMLPQHPQFPMMVEVFRTYREAERWLTQNA